MSEDRYPKQNESINNKHEGNTPSFKKPMFCNEEKCDISNFSEDVVTMTGKSWSRFMNIQNRKFTAISCSELCVGVITHWLWEVKNHAIGERIFRGPD